VKPFPHVVIDDFLPPSMAECALDFFPPDGSRVWKTPENPHTKSKSVMGVKDFAPEVRHVFEYLNSAQVLMELEELFGIKGLVPDPYFVEAGYHRIGRGGFLDIHADFSHHDHTGLERRLNLILYLNKDWKEEYRGNLKLYGGDLRPLVEIMPIFNRAVIFETGETSYHGHPEPLNCPDGEYRKSIAIYYYTIPRPWRKKRPAFFPTDPEFVHERAG